MTVGRPTDEELDRMEELVDEYFSDESYAIKAKLWDDGDVHLHAYSTIGSNTVGNVPSGVLYHREIVRYERESGVCMYREVYMRTFPEADEVIEEVEIDF